MTFRQISLYKLRDYLEQSPFEEYLSKSYRPKEEAIRMNLVASDFATTGLFLVDYFESIMAVVFLAKVILSTGLGNLKISNEEKPL